MKKNHFISAAAIAIALVTVITVSQGVSAANNRSAEKSFENRPQLTEEERKEFMAEREARREAVRAALDAGDYQAWASAVREDSPILEKINEDNFARFVEAHNHMTEAKTIFEELGIEKPGKGMGNMKGAMHRPFDR